MSNQLTVMVGGGAGLCGSHLSRWLLDRDYKIVILDDLSQSYLENIDQRAKVYIVDIKNYHKVKEIFETERPDYVYSAQAMAAEVTSSFIKNRTYSDNILTTVNLLSNSVEYNVKKFITFSSIAIWAGNETPPYNENTTANCKDSYGLSKYLSDLECQITKKQFGLDFSSVICHNYQGKYLNAFSRYRNFLGIAIRQALNDEPITIFGSGEQVRQFSDVKFLCEPLEKLLYTDCERVILGSDLSYKVIDVAKIIQNIAYKEDNKKINIIHLPERYEAKLATCDHSLAISQLGFKDGTDIEELCLEIYKWLKTQPQRTLGNKMNYEITKNLPPSWI